MKHRKFTHKKSSVFDNGQYDPMRNQDILILVVIIEFEKKFQNLEQVKLLVYSIVTSQLIVCCVSKKRKRN